MFTSDDSSQVSLSDPLRSGAGDEELREIIGAAVCFLLNDTLFRPIILTIMLSRFSRPGRWFDGVL